MLTMTHCKQADVFSETTRYLRALVSAYARIGRLHHLLTSHAISYLNTDWLPISRHTCVAHTTL